MRLGAAPPSLFVARLRCLISSANNFLVFRPPVAGQTSGIEDGQFEFGPSLGRATLMGCSSGGVTGPSVAFFVASHPSLWSAIAHNRSQCLRGEPMLVAATRALPLQAERLCRQVLGLGS